MKPNLIALLTLLSTGPLAVACAPSFCRPVAIKANVVAAVVPVAAVAYVPAYGATFQSNQADEVNGELLRQLVEQNRQIIALLQALAAAKASPPAVATPVAAESGEILFASRCARCHKAAVAASKGGGIVLQEDAGKMAPLSILEQRTADKAIDSGAMPPGGKLDAGQKATLKAFLKPKE